MKADRPWPSAAQIRFRNWAVTISLMLIVLSIDGLLSVLITQPANRWTGTPQTEFVGAVLTIPLTIPAALVRCKLIWRKR